MPRFFRDCLVRLALVVALLLTGTAPHAGKVLPGDNGPAVHPLTLAARVWGLAKYHHPRVTACALDWDQVLLDRVATLEAAGDGPARTVALAELLAAAGDTPRRIPDATTPRWITDATLDPALTERLAWLAAQRPQQQCYVGAVPNTQQAAFEADVGHATASPDRAHRALAAFRFWNAIEYFFPYKADIGRDWSWALDQTLQAILDGTSTFDYVLAIRALTAATEDSHAFLAHPPIHDHAGTGLPPFSVSTIEGRTIVVQAWDGAAPVQAGDELLAVDGVPVADERVLLDPLMHGSNPVFRDRLTLTSVLDGAPNPGTFTLRDAEGNEYTATLPRGAEPVGPLHGQPVWHRRELDGCSMGVLDLARLQPQQVDAALDALADTDALVFDVRNYPNGTLWPLADQLFPQPLAVALFDRPRLEQPGAWQRTEAPIGGRAPRGYGGRILVLQDERSISQSEYTVMGLQAIGRTLVFGSQTAGADGNITWIDLPGNIRAMFTGLGVYYPDGRATQRIGIVPDVHVRPTIAGLRAGRDEVLEAALDCQWLHAQPAPRLPPSGLYYAPERAGEGLDVHRAGDIASAISYGYDEAGEPHWLLSAGSIAAGDWASQFRAHEGIGAPSQLHSGYALDFHSGPYTPVCSRADQNASLLRGQWRWPGDDGTERQACMQPLLPSGNGAATGLWAGPPSEYGWGLSLHHTDGLLSVVVYAYDDAGNPRWLLGNATWDGSGEVDVALERMRGFCRQCPPTPVQSAPAGALRLRLDSVHTGNPADSWLDIDAQFAPGSRWQRTRMPLTRVLAATP